MVTGALVAVSVVGGVLAETVRVGDTQAQRAASQTLPGVMGWPFGFVAGFLAFLALFTEPTDQRIWQDSLTAALLALAPTVAILPWVRYHVARLSGETA